MSHLINVNMIDCEVLKLLCRDIDTIYFLIHISFKTLYDVKSSSDKVMSILKCFIRSICETSHTILCIINTSSYTKHIYGSRIINRKGEVNKDYSFETETK